MKNILFKKGIKVPKYQEVINPLDLVQFINTNKYPVIYKPVDGAGAAETFLITNEHNLEESIKNTAFRAFEVEEFIEGDVYHIDGIWNGEDFLFVVASKYISSIINFRDEGFTGSYIILEGVVSQKLIDYTREVLTALPTNSTIGFHCEVFLQSNDEVVLCEIASRIGGAKIVKMIEKMYGFNLQEKTLMAQINNDFNCHKIRSCERNYGVVGQILFLSKEGILLEVPKNINSEKILEYNINSKENNRYQAPQRIIDTIASVILHSENENNFLKEVKQIQSYFNNLSVWKEG